jgi:hypothetical protein
VPSVAFAYPPRVVKKKIIASGPKAAQAVAGEGASSSSDTEDSDYDAEAEKVS